MNRRLWKAVFLVLGITLQCAGCSSGSENENTPDQSQSLAESMAAASQSAAQASLLQSQQAVLDQISQAEAETAVDVSSLDESQIRSCFVSLPVSEELVARMDGDFYSTQQSFITPDDLRLVRVLYTDFDGNTKVGELIVNRRISADIEDIFFQLYENAYPIQRIVLPFGYYADDNAIMADGITRALAFTWADDGTTPLEHEHSLGLAVDFNSLYNPQVITNEDGSITVLPPQAEPYADRSNPGEHMLSEDDLAVQLFEQHGFTWGGIWEGRNDYQHFEKGFDHETGHMDPELGSRES